MAAANNPGRQTPSRVEFLPAVPEMSQEYSFVLSTMNDKGAQLEAWAWDLHGRTTEFENLQLPFGCVQVLCCLTSI